MTKNHQSSYKKCIVLDLDNTLWGGVIGEDGMNGIALSLTPPGNSFVAFQQALLDHYNKGVILAINSRNNPADALAVIRTHPNMVLKENHFSAFRINWNDKAQNLKELAKELNIGLDSMVFFDDDKTNRELVKAVLPEVSVPELPTDPAQYARFLNSLNYFNRESVTNEDIMRGNFYVTERLRKEEEKKYGSKEDFLKDLDLVLSVYEDSNHDVARISQLTEKTNQFNVFKRIMTESDIRAYVGDPNYRVFHARLTDKFGDHGIIAFALVRIENEVWHIESFLMSCRVLGRNVEDALLGRIISRALEEKAQKLTISFEKTEKNAPAEEFVSKHFNRLEYDILKVRDNPSWVKTVYENI